jgi:hypothetical protein
MTDRPLLHELANGDPYSANLSSALRRLSLFLFQTDFPFYLSVDGSPPAVAGDPTRVQKKINFPPDFQILQGISPPALHRFTILTPTPEEVCAVDGSIEHHLTLAMTIVKPGGLNLFIKVPS